MATEMSTSVALLHGGWLAATGSTSSFFHSMEVHRRLVQPFESVKMVTFTLPNT